MQLEKKTKKREHNKYKIQYNAIDPNNYRHPDFVASFTKLDRVVRGLDSPRFDWVYNNNNNNNNKHICIAP